MPDYETTSSGEEFTEFDEMMDDWSARAEKKVAYATEHADATLVETPEGGSSDSFADLVGSYGETAEVVAEHVEDGHEIVVVTDYTKTETDKAVDFYAEEIRQTAEAAAEGDFVTTDPFEHNDSFDGTVSAYAEQIEQVAEAYEDGRDVTYMEPEPVDFEDSTVHRVVDYAPPEE